MRRIRASLPAWGDLCRRQQCNQIRSAPAPKSGWHLYVLNAPIRDQLRQQGTSPSHGGGCSVRDWTLDRLHLVLQAAFGWTDSHLHEFRIGGFARIRGSGQPPGSRHIRG
uniref:plasmid pRiA4b ORF-3 family protein n=1 Tax=Paracoccus mutanolyticus TaxID=1499308 RepID=UPI001CB90045|nr:plasmid pRiA4b ORF-3 family protein [Paracoccus mutanolyticus]